MKKICKVLVVEDHEGIQEVLRESLSAQGYHFSMVTTGAEMRAALASDPAIDIVVIDIVLPGEGIPVLSLYASNFYAPSNRANSFWMTR